MAERGSEPTYRAIHDGSAWRVVPRDGVVVAGADATTWLQGQISQDLDGLRKIGANAETLVLSPQGRIDSYCRVTFTSDDPPGYLLDVTQGAGTSLFERLRRFKLRVKATVEVVGDLHVLEQRGPASMRVSERIAASPASGEAAAMAAELGGVADVDFSWPGFEGTDWLFTGSPSRIPALAAVIGLNLPVDGSGGAEAGAGPVGAGSMVLEEAFEAARIEAGVPELGRELTERTIPQEAGELVAHAVSFTKGCYTGQELVARIDARGSNTPRRLRGLVVEAAPLPGALDLSGSPVRLGEQTVGEVTSSAWSPGLDAVVALAYIKRGVEVPSDVTVEIAMAGSVGAAARPAGPPDGIAGGDGGSRTVPGVIRELPMSRRQAAGGQS